MTQKNQIAKAQQVIDNWMLGRGWSAFPYQERAWKAYRLGYSGIVNAPTGSGKTYSLFMAILMEYLAKYPDDYQKPRKNGLQAIWITPIRALAKEIQQSSQRVCDDLGVPWRVAIRTGDTTSAERAKQKRNMPEILITTPESLHLLLASKQYPKTFKNLKSVVVDEWHELIGSKRGVQMELALSRLRGLNPKLKTWGISATIGNMEESLEVLMGYGHFPKPPKIIKSKIKKRIEVISILPDEVEKFPWAGHLGIKLLDKILPIIQESKSTLIFTNTRAQCEIWYQRILEVAPDLAGLIAMHHGSISKDLRNWVEDGLHTGILKAVVCTSSLDLGVDFRPVESIIQIGGPKGVSRFMQRAGRSGHQPGATSRIYFLPTHALELVEAAGLRKAIKEEKLERRVPYIRSFDVLVQYLVTLAVSDGFAPEVILQEIRNTFSFSSVSDEEWQWALAFITSGGASLHAYDEYNKVVVEDGLYKVTDRRTAMRHRLSMGTIVSDVVMRVKYVGGKRLGTIEEWFISALHPGDVFWFAGRNLEFVRIKDLDVLVRKSKAKTGKIPSWQGGRMPLSSQLSEVLRSKLNEATLGRTRDAELKAIQPIIKEQSKRSHVPAMNELLIEQFETKEGYHLFVYPFEGRFVHEGISSLLAYRMSLLNPISFSIAFNDYGFEMLSDQPIPIQEALDNDFFTTDHLSADLQSSLNSSEMARRVFRDIATISGLVFTGYPGKYVAGKHLQASSQLFFEVFEDYDSNNLLLRQAFDEVLSFQLEEERLREALLRIGQQEIIVTQPKEPTPFAFPIMVDRLRERFTTEKLADRIKKMKLQLER